MIRIATLVTLVAIAAACGNRASLPADALTPGDDAPASLEDASADASVENDLPRLQDLVAQPDLDAVDLGKPDEVTADISTPPDDAVVEPDGDILVPPPDVQDDEVEPVEKPLLQINEVVANAPNGGPDWFELLATGDEAVNLANYKVVDGDPDHPLLALPNIKLLPGEYAVIEAIGAGEWSANPSIPYKFGDNDELRLVHDDELVDLVSWWGQAPPEGTSYGRLEDGTGDWQLCQPTPGADNVDVKLKLSTCYEPFLWDRVTPVSLSLESSDFAAMMAAPEDEAWFHADFSFGPINLNNVAVRVKGGKSIGMIAAMGSHRFSFKVDFNKYVDIMQFCGLKKVVFHNAYGDPTLLREHLSYRIARHLGVPAPRTALVDLTVGGEHLGTYLMVEPVDDDFFLDEHFKNDNGYLYEAGEPAGALADLGDSYADYPGFDLKTNQEQGDHFALLFFLNVLHNGSPGDFASVMDINDTLQYLAWNAALVNLDSYNGEGRNYYLYEQDGIFTPLPWDANEAFGSHGCGCSQEQLLAFAVDEPTCGSLADRPLLDKLLAVPVFKDKYHQYLQELLDGGLHVETFQAWLEPPAQLVRTGFAAGSYFYTKDEFEAALVDGLPGGGPDGDDIFGLVSFVTARAEHIKAQLEGTEPATHNGNGNCAVVN